MKKTVYADTRCKVSEKFGSDFQKICNSKFCKICEHHLNKNPHEGSTHSIGHKKFEKT